VHSDSLIHADRWGEVLNAPARRIMPYVPDQYFELGDSASVSGPSSEGGCLRIGLFGSLQPRKGQLQAVEAVGLLKSRFDASVQLRLFGYDHFHPEYLAACKEMAERYAVSSLVNFCGFVADSAEAMRNLDVLLCASDCESMPLAILEAMAAGRLVIAPNAGGIADAVSHGTGLLMTDNTTGSIVQAFAKLLRLTPQEWRDKVDLAREVARQECSKFPVAAELFRLYNQAAAAHAPASESAGALDSPTQ
jgi:O-antigen biosynthesis protein